MSNRTIKRNMTVLAITWALMSLFSSATKVYSSLYILELGGGPFEVGIIGMAWMIVLAFSQLVGGYLADTIGRKKIIVPMTIAYGLASLLYAFAPDWTWILLASILTSLALMYQPAIQAIVADTLPPEMRGRGISAANTLSQVTSLAGPPMATVLVSVMGLVDAMRILYLMGALAIIGAGAIRMLLIETHTNKTKISFKMALKEYINALKLLKGDLGKLLLITSSVRSLYQMSFPFVQIYVVKELGISEEFWGIISTLMSLESVFTMPLSGFLADKIGRNTVMALGYASGFIGLGMLAIAPREDPLFVLVSMLAAVAFASRPAALALMADLTGTGVRGKISAISGLLEGNLSGALSVLGGMIYDIYPPLTFCVASLALVPLTVAAWKILPRGLIPKS